MIPIKNLSELANGSLDVRAGSAAATNTVSVKPNFGAPGSDSESTQRTAYTVPMVPVGPEPIPDQSDSARETVLEHGPSDSSDLWVNVSGRSWTR